MACRCYVPLDVGASAMKSRTVCAPTGHSFTGGAPRRRVPVLHFPSNRQSARSWLPFINEHARRAPLDNSWITPLSTPPHALAVQLAVCFEHVCSTLHNPRPRGEPLRLAISSYAKRNELWGYPRTSEPGCIILSAARYSFHVHSTRSSSIAAGSSLATGAGSTNCRASCRRTLQGSLR